MFVDGIVKNGTNSFRVPICNGFVFTTVLARAERKGSLRLFSAQAVGREGVHHVAEHGVVDSVSDEADQVVSEQLANETRAPAFGEVR